MLMTMLAAVQAAPDRPARVVLTTHELPPYSFSGDPRTGGIAVDAVRCALKALQVDAEIRFEPWARAQSSARAGQADGFFAASRSPDRDAWAMLSVSIAPQQWRWYLLKNSPLDPQDPKFRETATVSSYVGANMQDWLKENHYRLGSAPINTEHLLLMLVAGRLDAVLANHLVMDKLLVKHDRGREVRSVLQLDKPLGVYFTKDFTARWPDFIEAFNRAAVGCRIAD